jgi:citrate synthase
MTAVANGTDGFTTRDRWSTTISQATPDALLLRGYPLIEVIRSLSFTEGTYLTLVGRLPDDRERRMLDALLCALLDHQFVSASVPAARYVASGNPQVVPAAAAGVLSAGANTLSPEDCARLLAEALALADRESLDIPNAARRIVRSRRENRQRIPGLGHPLYKDADPRAVGLLDIAVELGFAGPAVAMMRAIHEAFLTEVGKQVALNVDGMMSAIMLEMGLSPRQMVAVNLISYFPGILAHAVEEIEDGVPLRTIPDQLATYSGAGLRHLGQA